jgi:hypothetical protein
MEWTNGVIFVEQILERLTLVELVGSQPLSWDDHSERASGGRRVERISGKTNL